MRCRPWSALGAGRLAFWVCCMETTASRLVVFWLLTLHVLELIRPHWRPAVCLAFGLLSHPHHGRRRLITERDCPTWLPLQGILRGSRHVGWSRGALLHSHERQGTKEAGGAAYRSRACRCCRVSGDADGRRWSTGRGPCCRGAVKWPAQWQRRWCPSIGASAGGRPAPLQVHAAGHS